MRIQDTTYTTHYCIILTVPQRLLCLNYKQGILKEKNIFIIFTCNYFSLNLFVLLPTLTIEIPSAFLGWRRLWRIVVNIYYTTAAGNSISSLLGSSCQGNRYGTEKAGDMALTSSKKSHLPGHSPPVSLTGRRVGSALQPSASLGVSEKYSSP